MSCVLLRAGTRSCSRNAGSSSLRMKLMQSTGQMSMQASHSMHSGAENTVWISQLRQRSASLNASWSS